MAKKEHREGFTRIVSDGQPLEDAMPPFLVDEIVSSRLTLLFGQPKHGKSTLAGALAVSVTNGTPFLGRIPNAVGNVAIIAGDPGDDEEYYAMLLDRVPKGALAVYSFDRPPMPPIWADVKAELKQNDTRLVIVDNLNAFAPGDVNLSTTWRVFMDMLNGFIRNNIAVVLVHHASEKGGFGSGNKPQGYTGISGAARRRVFCFLPKTGPLAVTFDGNGAGEWSMQLSRPVGQPDFEVVKIITPDDLAASRVKKARERSKETLNKRQSQAVYWRDHCQGITNMKAADMLAAKFGGSAGTYRNYIRNYPDILAALTVQR